MLVRFLICFLIVVCVELPAYAQDEDFMSKLNYKVHKMQKELKLSQEQSKAITPVMKAYLLKRYEILQDSSSQGIIDHVSIKDTLKSLKEQEYAQLSKILNKDQMVQLVKKENLMAAMNPDNGETTIDGDTALTPNGANFKF